MDAVATLDDVALPFIKVNGGNFTQLLPPLKLSNITLSVLGKSQSEHTISDGACICHLNILIKADIKALFR